MPNAVWRVFLGVASAKLRTDIVGYGVLCEQKFGSDGTVAFFGAAPDRGAQTRTHHTIPFVFRAPRPQNVPVRERCSANSQRRVSIHPPISVTTTRPDVTGRP